MAVAMDEFAEGYLTDEGLRYCLQRVKYGDQFVAKTEHMCGNLEIIDEVKVNETNFPELDNYIITRRREGVNVIAEARFAYRRSGKYIDEIIDEVCDE